MTATPTAAVGTAFEPFRVISHIGVIRCDLERDIEREQGLFPPAIAREHLSMFRV